MPSIFSETTTQRNDNIYKAIRSYSKNHLDGDRVHAAQFFSGRDCRDVAFLAFQALHAPARFK